MAKEKAIIVDVDGTLADMRGVRSPFEWDKVLQDKPHPVSYTHLRAHET